jgi:hypothetical protein
VYRRFVWRRFVKETFCRGDDLLRRRFVEETFCAAPITFHANSGTLVARMSNQSTPFQMGR